MTTTTAQLNLRIPTKLKKTAQLKAENYGTNLNFLVKLFLKKFVEDNNIVEIKQNIKMEKIFDKWVATYFCSPEWKASIKRINKKISELLKDEEKYLV